MSRADTGQPGRGPITPLTLGFRAALMLALLAITHLATTSIDYPMVSSVWDKLEHSSAFLCLALLSDFSFPHSRWDRRKWLPLLGYGLLIELIQHFLPDRHFSLLDLGADAIGLLVYPLLLPLLLRLPLLSRHCHTGDDQQKAAD
ncbi:VanZ family protein [Candidatus Endoriftia persephone]|uniref:VanZ family protein n=1 Tax=Candidatus Endoriftia persephonae TaxID=393765 RepID=A0A9J6ZXZ6_9GAMM|nr:VanZ family protein [Candidatus Endoriftia persephone]USF87448.1 VanZ family protein [Candidatus Endoriftia persephone]